MRFGKKGGGGEIRACQCIIFKRGHRGAARPNHGCARTDAAQKNDDGDDKKHKGGADDVSTSAVGRKRDDIEGGHNQATQTLAGHQSAHVLMREDGRQAKHAALQEGGCSWRCIGRRRKAGVS